MILFYYRLFHKNVHTSSSTTPPDHAPVNHKLIVNDDTVYAWDESYHSDYKPIIRQ